MEENYLIMTIKNEHEISNLNSVIKKGLSDLANSNIEISRLKETHTSQVEKMKIEIDESDNFEESNKLNGSKIKFFFYSKSKSRERKQYKKKCKRCWN